MILKRVGIFFLVLILLLVWSDVECRSRFYVFWYWVLVDGVIGLRFRLYVDNKISLLWIFWIK